METLTEGRKENNRGSLGATRKSLSVVSPMQAIAKDTAAHSSHEEVNKSYEKSEKSGTVPSRNTRTARL